MYISPFVNLKVSHQKKSLHQFPKYGVKQVNTSKPEQARLCPASLRNTFMGYKRSAIIQLHRVMDDQWASATSNMPSQL